MGTSCENCGGTGQITFGVADGWDGREDCPACNGTGVVQG